MTPEPTGGGRRVQRCVGGVVLCACLAAAAALTTPFTPAAYALVLAVGAVLVVALVAQWCIPGGGPWPRVRHPDRAPGRAWPWLVPLAVVAVTEIVSFFAGGSRSLHPTLSWLSDRMLSQRAVKAVAFFGWTAGGWYVVRR